jgi:hypothetical protein
MKILNDIACTLNNLQIELNRNTLIGIWIEFQFNSTIGLRFNWIGLYIYICSLKVPHKMINGCIINISKDQMVVDY